MYSKCTIEEVDLYKNKCKIEEVDLYQISAQQRQSIISNFHRLNFAGTVDDAFENSKTYFLGAFLDNSTICPKLNKRLWPKYAFTSFLINLFGRVF